MQKFSVYFNESDLDEVGSRVPLKTTRAAKIFYLMKELEMRGALKWHLEGISEACANYIDWKYRKDLTAEFIVKYLN